MHSRGWFGTLDMGFRIKLRLSTLGGDRRVRRGTRASHPTRDNLSHAWISESYLALFTGVSRVQFSTRFEHSEI